MSPSSSKECLRNVVFLALSTDPQVSISEGVPTRRGLLKVVRLCHLKRNGTEEEKLKKKRGIEAGRRERGEVRHPRLPGPQENGKNYSILHNIL